MCLSSILQDAFKFLSKEFFQLETFDQAEKLGDSQFERNSNPLDVDQAEIPGTTLDVGNVGPMDACLVSQILLGHAKLFAAGSNGIAELLPDIGPVLFPHCGHFNLV